MSLIQSQVEKIIESQTEKRESQVKLTREEGAIAVDIARAETRLELKIDEEWFCDVCKERRDGLNAVQKKELAEDLAKLEKRQNEITTELEDLGNPNQLSIQCQFLETMTHHLSKILIHWNLKSASKLLNYQV